MLNMAELTPEQTLATKMDVRKVWKACNSDPPGCGQGQATLGCSGIL